MPFLGLWFYRRPCAICFNACIDYGEAACKPPLARKPFTPNVRKMSKIFVHKFVLVRRRCAV